MGWFFSKTPHFVDSNLTCLLPLFACSSHTMSENYKPISPLHALFLCVGANQAIPSSQEGSLSCNQSEHRIPLYCPWGLPAWLNLYDKIMSYISVYMSISTNLKLLVREFMIYKSLNLVWLFLFAEWSITSLTTMSWLEKIWWWKT